MVDLTQTEMIIGISYIILMVLNFIIALLLFVKYMRNKDKTLLYFSLFFIFSGINGLGGVLNFFSYLTTGGPISVVLFGAFIFGIRPIALIFWMLLITELMYKNKKKLILGIFAVYCIILYVISLYFFFTDISALIVEVGPPGTNAVITDLTRIIVLPTPLIMIVTTVLFYRESHKSDNPVTRLKGTLFLLGVLIQISGGIIFLITGNIIILNVPLVPGIILMYGAIAMPDWIKKRVVKKEQ